MRARNNTRPMGRADHKRRVEAATSELDKLLKAIAADPEAGPWAEWAVKLLESDGAATPTPSGESPGGAK